ncbi:4Fe-4S dicluster domain-containing protein [Geoalkalibacter ferrihydriticus]|uniref:(Fe-S)-binding protein n=2 Tax=Geoalkalibacter ferrihydriticus TaxID=392333 RepID=A0A0C2HI79_9BACT|nr:4Fe-4S dicluster domain-containing protein [Geoalkalibacter ferrihydriticus]KIH76661.1 (Fe-S)-binding protein [Geoalkalibacter ferrihydriticus DSM 17813]SDM05428.1 4Fe-4S dicluster domain-containing protein [Geoalkalibacter ferrihydriticus]
MAHLTARSSYARLTERLNRFPQGAPPSELLEKILALLFDPKEADLVARLPLRPFSAAKAARVWSMPSVQAQNLLEQFAARGLLVDMQQGGQVLYVLPPPMAGFFEFALMRVREDLDQKLLSRLFEQYISVEDDFVRALFAGGETQFGRVLVGEDALSSEHALHVLDYERAEAVIDAATHIGIGLCYCRHKRAHLGKACAAEMDICMTFNSVAASLIRHGQVRRVERSECKELLRKAREQNLAQFAENVQRDVNFICNCCPCCCEAMLAHQRFGHEHPIHTSNFIATVAENCSGCGRCLPVCPAKIITLETEQPAGRGRKRAVIDETLCLGCGVCVRACRLQALHMNPRAQRVITPVNAVHKTVLMAIERGTLQHLIFDNQVLWSHRALAALLGGILKLSPVKRALAQSQTGSRYLEQLCAKVNILRNDATS